MVLGFPEVLSPLRSDEVRTFQYTVQNLTPFTMQVLSRPDGCSPREYKVQDVGPFGQVMVEGVIDASEYVRGKNSATFHATGYCGEMPFVISKAITFEVR
jgi:hypothetical protein